jgi:hypothetical protein
MLPFYFTIIFLRYWVLNSGPTPWTTPPAPFCDEFFQYSVSWPILLGWLWTKILLTSASWVARITGMCSWCLVYFTIILKSLILVEGYISCIRGFQSLMKGVLIHLPPIITDKGLTDFIVVLGQLLSDLFLWCQVSITRKQVDCYDSVMMGGLYSQWLYLLVYYGKWLILCVYRQMTKTPASTQTS